MGSFEATLNLAQVTLELKTVYENLTSTQKRCTDLVEENRKLKTELVKLANQVAAYKNKSGNEAVHDFTDDHV